MRYSELISGLWISDVEMLNKNKFLEDNNITIILNCTQTFDFPKSESIKKVRLPFSPIRESDTDITLLRNNYKKIVDYISENIDQNNILISCYDGKSISPFVWYDYGSTDNITGENPEKSASTYGIGIGGNLNRDTTYQLSVAVPGTDDSNPTKTGLDHQIFKFNLGVQF